MNRHDILQKAVEKAVYNGYLNDENQIVGQVIVGSLKKGHIKIHIGYKLKPSQYWQTQSSDCSLQLYSIVFDKEFAKAFFGKTYRQDLQKMVLYDDPIEYIATKIDY